MQGIITSSGNDASVALAEHISGDEETFSIYMNQIATNMGLDNTNYVNSTGLPNDQLYTSAEDVAVLSRNLIKNFLPIIINLTVKLKIICLVLMIFCLMKNIKLKLIKIHLKELKRH